MTSQLQFTRPPTEPSDYPGWAYLLALVLAVLLIAGAFMAWALAS